MNSDLIKFFSERMDRLEGKVDGIIEQQAVTRTEVAVVKTKVDSLKAKVASVSAVISSAATFFLTKIF